MSLSANTNVASTVANYFTDNYTALLQAGTAVPPAYTAPATQAFADWKTANNDKKFYLEKSGDSYKLGSVSGSSASVPEGAEAVDLNVAYAIESKEMSLVDWMMGRIGDEIRQASAQQSIGSLLSFAPETDLSIDSSSMSQSDLEQLLKRLGRASSDLKTANALGNLADSQASASRLGLTASLLGEAMEQQRLFEEQAATLSTSVEAQALGNAQTNLAGAQSTLNTAILARDTASAALQAAQAPSEDASEDEIAAYQALQTTYDDALTDLTSAQTALTQAQAAVTQTQSQLEAADNFNEVMSAAFAQLVAEFTADMEAAQLAYNETAASTVSSSQLSGLTSTAGSALNSRLKSAADLALLSNPSISLFGSNLDVQQTDDGYVVNTSAMASRETQVAAVRAALVEALSDPALQTALADAMAANADSLGNADMALPDQTQLYNEVAGAVIAAMLSNDAYLNELAGGAVDFGNQLSQMLGNELASASRRDNALMSSSN